MILSPCPLDHIEPKGHFAVSVSFIFSQVCVVLRPIIIWRSSITPIYTAVAKFVLLPSGKTGFVDEDINAITISEVDVIPLRTHSSGSQALLAWIRNPGNHADPLFHLEPSTATVHPLISLAFLILPVALIFINGAFSLLIGQAWCSGVIVDASVSYSFHLTCFLVQQFYMYDVSRMLQILTLQCFSFIFFLSIPIITAFPQGLIPDALSLVSPFQPARFVQVNVPQGQSAYVTPSSEVPTAAHCLQN